jgi:hypothetical protein
MDIIKIFQKILELFGVIQHEKTFDGKESNILVNTFHARFIPDEIYFRIVNKKYNYDSEKEIGDKSKAKFLKLVKEERINFNTDYPIINNVPKKTEMYLRFLNNILNHMDNYCEENKITFEKTDINIYAGHQDKNYGINSYTVEDAGSFYSELNAFIEDENIIKNCYINSKNQSNLVFLTSK